MQSTTPNSELLRSLGRLVRGLSALFWGLPASLLIAAETARAEWLRPLGFAPSLMVSGLLLYGLWQLTGFQKQERPWTAALDRALLLGLVIAGLSPFIYWHNRLPEVIFFERAVNVLELAGILFLFNLNLVLKRLGAMLPDETLRQETRQFTAVNRWLLVGLVILAAMAMGLVQLPHPPAPLDSILSWIVRASNLLLVLFVLLPLAMTMALIWKTKEIILASVFGGGN